MVYELTRCHQDDNDRDAEQDSEAPASEEALRDFLHMGIPHSRSLRAVFLLTTCHDPQRVISSTTKAGRRVMRCVAN